MSENEPIQLVNPPENISSKAHIGSMDEYLEKYNRSIEEPEEFWSEMAQNFHWFKSWKEVRSYNYDMDRSPVDVKWFAGAKTNVCFKNIWKNMTIFSLMIK